MQVSLSDSASMQTAGIISTKKIDQRAYLALTSFQKRDDHFWYDHRAKHGDCSHESHCYNFLPAREPRTTENSV